MAVTVKQIKVFLDSNGNLYQTLDKSDADLSPEQVSSVKDEKDGRFFLAKRYFPYPPAPNVS